MEQSKTSITKMKVYALISLIIFCGVGCRSSSNTLDTSLRAKQTEKKKEGETKVERQNSLLVGTKKTDLNMQVDEDITLIIYDPLSGNIQSVQNTKRSTAKNKQTDSSATETNSNQSYNEKNIDISSKTNIETVEHQESKGDSRPVQGIEWLCIIVPIVVIVVIVYLIRYGRK